MRGFRNFEKGETKHLVGAISLHQAEDDCQFSFEIDLTRHSNMNFFCEKGQIIEEDFCEKHDIAM